MKSIIKPITTILFAIAFSSAVFAQSLGSLRGLVGDATGRAISNARVVLLFSGKLATREGRTGKKGDFFFDRLKPGNYTVAVEAIGLTQSGGAQPVEIVAGREFQILIPLTVATIKDAVIISASRTDSPMLESPASAFI